MMNNDIVLVTEQVLIAVFVHTYVYLLVTFKLNVMILLCQVMTISPSFHREQTHVAHSRHMFFILTSCPKPICLGVQFRFTNTTAVFSSPCKKSLFIKSYHLSKNTSSLVDCIILMVQAPSSYASLLHWPSYLFHHSTELNILKLEMV